MTPAQITAAGDTIAAIKPPTTAHIRVMTDGAIWRLELLDLDARVITYGVGCDLHEAYRHAMAWGVSA